MESENETPVGANNQQVLFCDVMHDVTVPADEYPDGQLFAMVAELCVTVAHPAGHDVISSAPLAAPIITKINISFFIYAPLITKI